MAKFAPSIDFRLYGGQESFSRYKGFARDPECSVTEGMQASWRREHPSTPLWWHQHCVTYFMEGQALFYVNLGQAKPALTPWLKSELYGTTAGEGVLNTVVPQIQKQSGKADCKCFAITLAIHLTYGAWQAWNCNIGCEQLHSHLEASAQAAVYTLFNILLKIPSIHGHKHYLLTCIFVFTTILFCAGLL